MSDTDRNGRANGGGGEREEAPPTRRSSPLPSFGGDLRIPPLRPVSIDAPAHDEMSDESAADIAPIGPTEHAGFVAVDSEEAPTESARIPPAPRSVEQLEQQIRDLEARLDDMIARGPAAFTPPPPAPETTASPAAPAAAWPPPQAEHRPPTARELLGSEFYLRQWGRAGMRRRAEEVDEFGLDPKYEARFAPFFDLLYKHYFRVEAEGAENIPDEGRCLIVANHSGGPLPYDGIMLRTTVRREHPTHRELRWLAEDFVYHLPFVGTAMNRLGAVRACQENAERLLAGGRLVAVFPEGAKGIGKLYKDRYRLQRFGRGGFIRLCLRTRTPIVPCAIVGAEEANPMLFRVEFMAKALGMPYLPVTPTFPMLGPLGLLPAPTKWKVTFGAPIVFDHHAPDAADDEVLVGRLSERVRATIQAMLDRTLAARQSVWFG
jgi:1-acyl-sn-glycerol-3-phosphate acyltransferase